MLSLLLHLLNGLMRPKVVSRENGSMPATARAMTVLVRCRMPTSKQISLSSLHMCATLADPRSKALTKKMHQSTAAQGVPLTVCTPRRGDSPLPSGA